MAGKKTNGHRPKVTTCTLYKYKGQAPIMAHVLDAIGDDFKSVYDAGGPARSTMRGWKNKSVGLATFRTMENALRAKGKTFTIGDL